MGKLNATVEIYNILGGINWTKRSNSGIKKLDHPPPSPPPKITKMARWMERWIYYHGITLKKNKRFIVTTYD